MNRAEMANSRTNRSCSRQARVISQDAESVGSLLFAGQSARAPENESVV